MPKIIQNSLSEQIYDLLKKQILSGELKQGAIIAEETLAEQFGVSRTPIREAVRRLSEYGLVEITPRSHATVAGVSTKESENIARIRVALETLAIRSITPELFQLHAADIARSAADCQCAIAIGDRATAFAKDSLFHLSLISASGSQTLYEVYERLDAKIQLLRIEQNVPEPTLIEYISQHSKIMQLLKDGRTDDCIALVTEHIMHKNNGLCSLS